MRDEKRMSSCGESAKIHYLSVLYLFHMLLLSNLSLQILDSENKQMDQSCCLVLMHHCEHQRGALLQRCLMTRWVRGVQKGESQEMGG